MTRSPSWRELDAATMPPMPRRPTDEDAGEHTTPTGTTDLVLGDGPVDGWTDTDEFLTAEP